METAQEKEEGAFSDVFEVDGGVAGKEDWSDGIGCSPIR